MKYKPVNKTPKENLEVVDNLPKPKLAKKSSDGNESKSECCNPIISLTNDHHNNDTPYSKKDADNRISALTNDKIGIQAERIFASTYGTYPIKDIDKRLCQQMELSARQVIHQAEITRAISELNSLANELSLHTDYDLTPIRDRIEALEKEIVA